MNINLWPKKCSSQSHYGRYSFYATAFVKTQTKELTILASQVSLSSHQTKWLREREIKAGDSTRCGLTQYVQHILRSVYYTMQYIGQRKGWTSNLTGYLLVSWWTYPFFFHSPKKPPFTSYTTLARSRRDFPYVNNAYIHIKSLLRVLKQVFIMYY